MPGRGVGRTSGIHRLARPLHPGAWWLWALGLATAASRTTNPVLLVLIAAVLALVVVSRRVDAPWARSFRAYLLLALSVIGIRVLFRAVFGGGSSAGQHVLFTLPHVPLPHLAAGVQLGGPVTAEGALGALYDGLQLACLLCCLGAANSLANPKRALRVLPGALFELGVAVVVALSVAPQLVESVQRVRRARRLRGGDGRRGHVLRSVAIPVLEDALERSLRLAAAMDSRGYGRTVGASPRSRQLTAVLMIGGLGGLCVGAYGLLDASTPGALGLPAIIVGALLCVAGLALGSRRVGRTSYRPDPWRWPEWGVVAAGALPAAIFLAAAGTGVVGLHPTTDPIAWPTLPVLPALAVLVSASAAVIAPPPPRPGVEPPRPAAARSRAPGLADRRPVGTP